jgi:hypothetical protein
LEGKTTDKRILLGYEVKTAKPVDFVLHHLIITGMTQRSGKTTTLEALVQRSGLKAITFRTKRGEIGFESAHKIPLFFDDKALTDWRAIEGLMEATLEERVRREPGVRPALINICRNPTPAKGLNDIYQRIIEKDEDPKQRGFMADVYTKLRAYLEIVIPQIEKLKFSRTLELSDGANMMDLVEEGLSDEMQNLILYGVLNWIYEKEKNVIVVIPEAWKFIPQDRGSPCKGIVEKLIREGAAIGNYLWIDSQDLRAVDKKYTRSIDNWILGRQRDRREVEETLKAIPIEKKPMPLQIMTLGLGEFIACLHDDVSHVYVQPAWLGEITAKRIALGELKVEDIKRPEPEKEDGEEMWKEKHEELEGKYKALVECFEVAQKRIVELEGEADKAQKEAEKSLELINKAQEESKELRIFVEAFQNLFKVVIPAPAGPEATASTTVETTVKATQTLTHFNITVQKEVLEATDKDVRGQILLLAAKGSLDQHRRITAVRDELKRSYDSSPRPGTLESTLAELVTKGILDRERTGTSWEYWLPPEAKKRITVKE